MSPPSASADHFTDDVLAPAMDANADEVTSLTPSEMVGRTGVSLDTLRYYEREGLLTEIVRAASGHRRYRTEDVVWVEVLRCLRTSGMSMQQLRDYAALVRDGPHTEHQRLAQLDAHRGEVVSRIRELHDALDVIDHKIHVYRTALGLDPIPTPDPASASDPAIQGSDA